MGHAPSSFRSRLCASSGRDARIAIALGDDANYLKPMAQSIKAEKHGEMTRQWTLAPAATMGSFVRAKGILQEVRSRLPPRTRKLLDVQANVLTLAMPSDAAAEFQAACTMIAKALETIEDRPVIPREIEDILSISVTERHRWLKDGRLPSAGTRTVNLRGRARKITFHVFDPQKIADILDGDVVSTWREQDAETAAENRRRAAWNAKHKRAQKIDSQKDSPRTVSNENPGLVGWEDFERDGPLR